MNDWYKKLLLLLMMASDVDTKDSERKRIAKLANELLDEWFDDVPIPE